MMKIKSFNLGFTMVELIVVMGIMMTLFAIGTISLSRVLPNTSQNATLDMLLADIKSQQTLAMSKNSNFGIHFNSTSYVLTPSNFTIGLDPTLTITNVSFTNGDLEFTKGSGNTTAGTFTIENNQTGKVTTVNINQYGAATY